MLTIIGKLNHFNPLHVCSMYGVWYYMYMVLTQIQEWLFTIGYVSAYGALLAKLWRVYKIFHNPAPNKKV